MDSISVTRSRELKWPLACAYCNGPAHSQAESKHSTISGLNPFYYTRSFLTVRYPVCRRHRLLGRLHSFLSHQSFVDLFVGFIFIPLVLALPLLAIPSLTGEQTNWLVLLLYAAYPILVFTLKARMPVRVLKSTSKLLLSAFPTPILRESSGCSMANKRIEFAPFGRPTRNGEAPLLAAHSRR